MRSTLSLLFWAGLVVSSWGGDFESLRLENWHHWRGPSADGVSPGGNPPTKWDESTNVKWKTRIPGSGSSTPIVWQDKIFLTTAVKTERKGKPVADSAAASPSGRRSSGSRAGQGGGRSGSGFGSSLMPPEHIYQFLVLCLDRETGRVLWTRVATEQQPHEGHHGHHGFASGSATTDGQRLYVTFGSRGIYCFDLDGNLEWERDLGDMKTRMSFGEGASPAVHGNSLVVTWDHEGPSFIVCLDAATGSDKWRVDRDEPTTWNTPLIIEHNGVTQVIVNGTNRARSYDLADGRLIWECGGQATNPIASPVAAEGIVYCMTGRQGYALYAIPLDAAGDITGSEKICWRRGKSTPYVASPLLYGGLLYFVKERNGILTCVRAKTGEELYAEQRLEAVREIYSSIGGAAGKVYLTGRDGTTVVIKHGPELEILATNRLEEGIDASPVFVGRDLFLRGTEHLYCISEQQGAAE
ncbi:MAG: PQQ-binding-like beta-propeller repeat protein [Planctomycetaceae bacterium]|nr:PQQ-binding-like beta-propeller repeat protein [Planctomycetaceae bacterium]